MPAAARWAVPNAAAQPGRGAEIGVCGTCMDARGVAETELAEGAQRGTLEQLTDWTLWADKVLVL
jgi:uncharacterized protein involved in oxidation of intracellular sulfur